MSQVSDAPVTEDRRIRRTKASLRRAIVELVLEHGYQAVTVDRIADHADVTRATLYAHYAGKEELLGAVVDDFGDRVLAAVSEHSSLAAVNRPSRMVALFATARDEADLLRLILRGEGDGAALRRLTQRISEVVDEATRASVAAGGSDGAAPRLDLDLVIRLRTAQVVAALGWFIEHPELDPGTVAEQVTTAIDRGAVWAAGLNR